LKDEVTLAKVLADVGQTLQQLTLQDSLLIA